MDVMPKYEPKPLANTNKYYKPFEKKKNGNPVTLQVCRDPPSWVPGGRGDPLLNFTARSVELGVYD